MENVGKTVVAEVYSKQLQQKLKRPAASNAPFAQGEAPPARAAAGGPEAEPRPRRPSTDSFLRWNALPNEWIVPLGTGPSEPVLGGSLPKWRYPRVLRFPSSIQRIEFRTDNISSENQGVLLEGWACWRVSDPRLAVEKLDFADQDDPMARTSKTLAIECGGIMKGLISVKTVHDLLKRREDLIDKLREKLQATEKRWGISFDEVGISDVQVLSQAVFENLQRPFRNEAREVAAVSDLETEERIAQKTATQKERVAKIEADNEARLREIHAASEAQVRTVESKEEQEKLAAEQALAVLRARAAHEREVEQAHARHRLGVEEGRLAQEKQLEQAKAEAELRVKKKELDLLKAAIALEVEKADRAVAVERLGAELETLRARARAAAETAGDEASAQRARDELRLRTLAEEREILGRVTDAELRQKLVASLPEIARAVPVGDVRWYGGGGNGGADGGPMGLLGKALEQVLTVAESHGLDVKDLFARGATPPTAAAAAAPAGPREPRD